jgi:hypothetical protein
MRLLCLIAAMSGVPLRQAEAASDFVRALGALADAGAALAEPDGGVGDDQAETVLKTDVGQNLQCARAYTSDISSATDFPPSLFRGLSVSAPVIPAPREERALWLPTGAARRQSRLQLYLF